MHEPRSRLRERSAESVARRAKRTASCGSPLPRAARRGAHTAAAKAPPPGGQSRLAAAAQQLDESSGTMELAGWEEGSVALSFHNRDI